MSYKVKDVVKAKGLKHYNPRTGYLGPLNDAPQSELKYLYTNGSKLVVKAPEPPKTTAKAKAVKKEDGTKKEKESEG